MAKKSHVPKFGNWDGDNVPYTAYFENARKEKGGVMINPNDPEQNPEAFMFGGGGAGSHIAHVAPPSPLHVTSDKLTSAEKYQIEGYQQTHHRTTFDHQKIVNQKSITSESGSDKSSSDYSLKQQNHRNTRSERKKSMTEVNNNFIPQSPGPNRPRYGNDRDSFRSASVPMFGAWDEKDPKSGEGFTVIFNKVKEEKKIAAATFPPVPSQPSNYANSQNRESSSKKWCCGLC